MDTYGILLQGKSDDNIFEGFQEHKLLAQTYANPLSISGSIPIPC